MGGQSGRSEGEGAVTHTRRVSTGLPGLGGNRSVSDSSRCIAPLVSMPQMNFMT
jgi:hypothetical protein